MSRIYDLGTCSSLWNVQGPLLHSVDNIVPRILTVDYTFKQHSEVMLNCSKTAFVNIVYKFFKRLLSYTRLSVKLGFGKTSFVNLAV